MKNLQRTLDRSASLWARRGNRGKRIYRKYCYQRGVRPLPWRVYDQVF